MIGEIITINAFRVRIVNILNINESSKLKKAKKH